MTVVWLVDPVGPGLLMFRALRLVVPCFLVPSAPRRFFGAPPRRHLRRGLGKIKGWHTLCGCGMSGSRRGRGRGRGRGVKRVRADVLETSDSDSDFDFDFDLNPGSGSGSGTEDDCGAGRPRRVRRVRVALSDSESESGSGSYACPGRPGPRDDGCSVGDTSGSCCTVCVHEGGWCSSDDASGGVPELCVECDGAICSGCLYCSVCRCGDDAADASAVSEAISSGLCRGCSGSVFSSDGESEPGVGSGSGSGSGSV